MSKKPAAAAVVETPVEPPPPAYDGPTAHFVFRLKNGTRLMTADRPTPTLNVAFTFCGSETETETITGNADPEFGLEKSFDAPATEGFVKDLISKPIEFRVFDTKPVGKTQEKVQIGKALLNLTELVFWKEQTEEEEMQSIVTVTKTIHIPELGTDSTLTVFVQAPEHIIPKEQLDTINMLNVKIISAHGLPPTWQLKEGEDPAATTFSYLASLNLPFGEDGPTKVTTNPAAIVPGGPKPPPEEEGEKTEEGGEPQIHVPPNEEQRRAALVADEPYLQKLVWNHMSTFILGGSDLAKLKAALQRPIQLDFQKLLKSGNSYPYTRRYKGVASLNLTSLLEPGNTICDAFFDLTPASDALDPLTDEEKALLPEAQIVDPKAKGAKVPPKGKGATTGPEFEAEPDQDPDKLHPFLDCFTYVRVHFSLLRPIVPTPPPPRPPLPRVADLIPHRPYLPPVKAPMDASEEFSKQLATIVDEIAEEYIKMFNAGTGGDSLEDRKQRLGLHLTKTGSYFTIKERLKGAVQKIVRERFHKNSEVDSVEEMKVMSNDLFVYLTTLLNRTLNAKFKSEPPPDNSEGNIPERVEQHRKLAEEAEMMLNMESARRNYSQRIILCKHREDLWFDCGSFHMRMHDLVRAEECFREAIALNPNHLPSLLSYGSLICTRDKITQAESYFTAATKAYPNDLLAWALLGLFYDLEDRDADRRRVFKLMLGLEDSLGESRKSPYVRAAHFLNTIHCTQLVEHALSQELLRTGNSVEIGVLLGSAYLNRGDHENARKYLQEVLKSLDKRCGLAMCLLGHSFFLEKQVKEAVQFYEQALSLRVPYVDITLYMRLAALCASINKQFEAKDYFLRACRLHATASSWLGLGVACYNMAQFSEAEEALAEANIYDPHNPEVWGWLTILSLKTAKSVEAESSYKEAIKNNLVSVPILREIGRGYLKQGKFSVAEGALRRSLAHGEDAGAYRLLGDILLEYKEFENAIDCFKKVVAVTRSGDDRRHSLRQLVAVSKALNRTDDAAFYAQLPDIATN